jgi:hypothetical protein
MCVYVYITQINILCYIYICTTYTHTKTADNRLKTEEVEVRRGEPKNWKFIPLGIAAPLSITYVIGQPKHQEENSWHVERSNHDVMDPTQIATV